MEEMNEMEEKEDIYYVEIPNNKRFKGVYINKKVILEKEIVDEDVSSIITEVDNIINDISNLNIDNELKKYLLKSELRMFNLKSKLRDIDLTCYYRHRNIKDDFDGLKMDFKQLKHDLLGAEDNKIDEAIDED